jgi:hypothetical protein
MIVALTAEATARLAAEGNRQRKELEENADKEGCAKAAEERSQAAERLAKAADAAEGNRQRKEQEENADKERCAKAAEERSQAAERLAKAADAARIARGVETWQFGKAAWETYFGPVDLLPPLPAEATARYDSLHQTHALVLVPGTVGGKPLVFSCLKELAIKVGAPFTLSSTLPSDLPERSSHWVLITREAVAKTENQTFEEQQRILRKSSYRPLTALEAATCILAVWAKERTRLYGVRNEKSFYWTLCTVPRSPAPVIVGAFNEVGLRIKTLRPTEKASNYGCAGALLLEEERFPLA